MYGSRSVARWLPLLAGALAVVLAGTAGVAQAAPAPLGQSRPATAHQRPGHGGAKSGPTSVAYVEVNSNSMLNVGKYTLANGGANVFDIAVVFAANINDNGTGAYLYFNPQVQSVLDNAATQIRPLQAKGIKVELSVLGNHQGAGFANFPSRAAAAAFARQLSNAVTKYGLDGIDFDDEYADYGANGTAQPNASSFVYLVQALRADMPGKLITLYDIGPSASRLVYRGTDVGPLFDYSWNPYYDSFSVPAVSLPNSKLGPAAVDFGSTPDYDAADLAQQTVDGGYGAFLTYDLTSTDVHDYISNFTDVLYGSDAVHTP
ncbi:endo-beta-N-acetylglucosaminidase H [Kitasatospora sp. NPDC058965]|uniref:endo-beta-N-acetylglucosaminidase H n=1 Tax=Kitasatospora sp. NPDC058965 TaxID=3346682 RepID=UPI003694CA81